MLGILVPVASILILAPLDKDYPYVFCRELELVLGRPHCLPAQVPSAHASQLSVMQCLLEYLGLQ